MVQFLSIIFFSWISSIFVGVFKSSRFFVLLCTNLSSFVQIGAGKGRTFHVGVSGVAVTALALGPRDILEVKNACVLRHGVHHLQSSSPKFCHLIQCRGRCEAAVNR